MAYKSKSHRKFLATSLSAALVATVVAPTAGFAAEFPDVSKNHEYYETIQALSEAGVVTGMPDGKFDLGGKVTRAQASQMVAKILKLGTDAPATPFKDVKKDAWYTDAINALYAAGHIQGLDKDTFAPDKTMTRAEFAQLIVAAYDIPAKDAKTPFTDVKAGAWYESAIETLYANELIKGQTATTFGPSATIKRGDFAYLLANTDYKFGDTLNPSAVVESVSATNATTLSLTGNALQKLKAADLSVEGAEIASVTGQGKSATVKFKKELISGKEYTLKVKTEDGTKEFKFTYKFNLADVKIATTVIDDDTDKQYVEFTVNGERLSVDYLKNVLGYDVEFQADKDVFVDNDGAATAETTKVSKTGEINETSADVAINKSFNVKLVLSKDGAVAQSDSVKVEVVNKNATPAIGDIIIQKDGVELNSKTVVIGDTSLNVAGIKSITGETIAISGNTTYTSSNEAIALVNSSNGAITPIAPGTVTITVKAGAQTNKIELTVSNVAREIASITPAKSTVQVAPGKTVTVAVQAKDQYGDYIAINSAAVVETSSNTKIVPADLVVDKTGKAVLSVAATDGSSNASAGNYNVYLKDTDNKLLNTLAVQVTTATTADKSKSKLEVAPTSESKDNALDLQDADDNQLTLNINEYTVDGGFVGLGTTGYTVESKDGKIATAVNASGVVTVTPLKAGSTDIVLKNANGTVINVYTVSVTNEVAKVSSINWKSTPTVIAAGETLSVEDVLTIEKVDKDDIVKGFTLSKNTSSFVRIDNSADTDAGNGVAIYLDKNDNGTLDAGEQLGTLAVSIAPGGTGKVVGTSKGNLNILGATTASADKGTIVVSFTDTVSNPAKVISSATLNVDVK